MPTLPTHNLELVKGKGAFGSLDWLSSSNNQMRLAPAERLSLENITILAYLRDDPILIERTKSWSRVA